MFFLPFLFAEGQEDIRCPGGSIILSAKQVIASHFNNFIQGDNMNRNLTAFFTGTLLLAGGVSSIAAEAADISTDFVETVRDWDNPAELSSAAIMQWFSNTKCSIPYSSKKFVSYKIVTESYTGGAHGMTNTRVGTFRNRKKVTLADLPKNVPALWKKAVAKHFKAADFDSYAKKRTIFFPRITENFYLDDKGIHFIYDPYEIDCYAAGTIDIFVPYTIK